MAHTQIITKKQNLTDDNVKPVVAQSNSINYIAAWIRCVIGSVIAGGSATQCKIDRGLKEPDEV